MNLIKLYPKVKLYSEVLLFIIFIFSLVSLISIIGFYISEQAINSLFLFTRIALILFISQEILRIIIIPQKLIHIRERWFELAVSILFLAILLLENSFLRYIGSILVNYSSIEIKSIALTAKLVLLIIIFAIKSTRYFDSILKLNIHPAGIFAISFVIIILIGTIFLILPKATVPGKTTSLLDALFTSTSAVCVTGLVVHNTAEHFSLFGQIIILILIQIGGLGVMTLTTFFAAFLSGGLSVRVRLLMRDYFNQLNLGNIYQLILKIFIFTITIEIIGASILFVLLYNPAESIEMQVFHSIFHSVSAFCNAGFSTYPAGMMENLVQSNYLYLSVISILIILGGLGFTVLLEIYGLITSRKKNLSLYIKNNLSISSKIVILTTAAIISIGTLTVFLLNLTTGFLRDFSSLFHSFFIVVSSRTAGFNTFAIELMPVSIAFLIIFIMWIGASPGSTGGGIKTTTFAITTMSLINHILGKERLEFAHRQIDQSNIYTAYLVVIANIVSLSLGIFLLLLLEPSKEPFDLVFEAVSAASTVGLSRNVTPHLGDGGKIIIILLMFIGRVGFLNFFLAFYKPSKEPNYHYKKETIMVG